MLVSTTPFPAILSAELRADWPTLDRALYLGMCAGRMKGPLRQIGPFGWGRWPIGGPCALLACTGGYRIEPGSSSEGWALDAARTCLIQHTDFPGRVVGRPEGLGSGAGLAGLGLTTLGTGISPSFPFPGIINTTTLESGQVVGYAGSTHESLESSQILCHTAVPFYR